MDFLLAESWRSWSCSDYLRLSGFGIGWSNRNRNWFVGGHSIYHLECTRERGNEQSVAVYGCIGYVTSIIYLLLQGVGDGSQPLISNYYGKKDTVSIRHTRGLAYKTAFVITVICMAGVYIAREQVGILFGASTDANIGVIQYMPYFLTTLLFLAFVRITNSYFYATEKTVISYVLVYAEPVCHYCFC